MMTNLILAGVAVISQFSAPMKPAGLPVIPWVEEADASWFGGKPLFEIGSKNDGVTARGWMAETDKFIRLRLVVRDEDQVNDQSGGNIWNGDSLQIGIDARGDGSLDMPDDTEMMNVDDASITVALTARGPEIWAHIHGKYGATWPADGSRKYPCSITRDENTKTTTYEISFPWDEFASGAGLYPTLGFAVQVNDTARSGTQNRIYWGHGADGMTRPGLMTRLATSQPPHEFFNGDLANSSLWRASDSVEMKLLTASAKKFTIRAIMGRTVSEKVIPPSTSGMARYFSIRSKPVVFPFDPGIFKVEVLDADGKSLFSRQANLETLTPLASRLHDRIEGLVARSPHPLFTRHLRAVDALVQYEWTKGFLVLDASPNTIQEAARYTETVLKGLEGDAARWQTYLQGKKALVLSRLADPDKAIEYFMLTLPRNWDENRMYPLIVDLHGHWKDHPLAYATVPFNQDDPAQTNVKAGAETNAFVMTPWARANNGYSDIGEADVFQAMEMMNKLFKIDGNRTFLSGHSMGGGGSWGIALRTPDLWAAVCVVAGGTWYASTGFGLGRNVSLLPFRIWHGSSDGAVSVDEAYAMQAELKSFGNDPDLVIVPGLGHEYPWQAHVENFRWLLQHTRKRPDRFSFVVDRQEHRGVWGIALATNPVLEPRPRFDCRIEGKNVFITTEGTTGLSVNPGKDGLGLSGDIALYWNGRKSYEGPVKQIDLGTGGGDR